MLTWPTEIIDLLRLCRKFKKDIHVSFRDPHICQVIGDISHESNFFIKSRCELLKKTDVFEELLTQICIATAKMQENEKIKLTLEDIINGQDDQKN